MAEGRFSNFSAVAVLGAGQMGGGIAHVCALSGLATILYDKYDGALSAAQGTIGKNLARQVRRGDIDEAAAQEAVGRLRVESQLGGWLAEVDAVIEAVPEEMAVKTGLFAAVSPRLRAGTLVASNTSSFSITALADAVRRADRFVGMHFMNPVPMMPLVEIIAGYATSEDTLRRAEALATLLGKQTVRSGDSPGFITNRLLIPMLNEAVFALQWGVGDVRAIDRAMVLGMRHPMGPLALADFIGLDTCLAIMQVMHEGFEDSKYQPCPLLEKMVDAGHLGKKSGVGFYDYRGEEPAPRDFRQFGRG